MKREEFEKELNEKYPTNTASAHANPWNSGRQWGAKWAFELLSPPPAEGAQQKYAMQGWICPRCGRVYGPFTTVCNCAPETKTVTTVMPTAEGAEEILKGILTEIWDTPPSDVFENPEYKMTLADVKMVAERFATLHAQRLADKMVSERLREMRPEDEDFPEFDESMRNDVAYCIEWGMRKQRDIERRMYDNALNSFKSRSHE